ncbi:MAG: UTP--glucose-1-phosphate uridylyltransferase [Magnetovibrio sp.]|nr:UTP--glucose-1-phosphate uridylyltransferase [Magnetovibrio sp.]
MNKIITKVVFPVAGLGTRFLPATKAVPKEMLPIVDRPLIQYAVEEARAAGITDFIFVVGEMNRSILQAHFGENDTLNAMLAKRGKTAELKRVAEASIAPEHIHFCTQDEPLGLGHAVWCARDFIDEGESFAVILPDDLISAKPGCLSQMMDVWRDRGGNVVAIEDVPREMTNRYGILDVTEDDGVIVSACGLVEKPAPEVAPSTLSIIGRYILDGRVFEHLDKHIAGAGGEIQLTDAISKTIKDVGFHGVRFEGLRFDCGSMAGFVEANAAFALSWLEHEADVRERLNRHI